MIGAERRRVRGTALLLVGVIHAGCASVAAPARPTAVFDPALDAHTAVLLALDASRGDGFRVLLVFGLTGARTAGRWSARWRARKPRPLWRNSTWFALT